MLGYFSVVGLLRVHSLLGDFTLALKVMENVELNQKVRGNRLSVWTDTDSYSVAIHTCDSLPCHHLLLCRLLLHNAATLHRCDQDLCVYPQLNFADEAIPHQELSI